MIVPIEELDQRQRLWFVKLIINVVLTADDIGMAEMNFVQTVINLITEPEVVKSLLKQWEAEEKFELEDPPESLTQGNRALIYMEVIHLVIQDKQLNEKESKFLGQLAKSFAFSPNYYNELMHHCLEGLAWLQGQNEILDEEIDAIHPVNVYSLAENQREWYARLMVIGVLMVNNATSAITDKAVLAIDSLQSKQMKQLLKAHLSKKIMPGPKPPPPMLESHLIRILMDLLQVLGSRGGISEKGDRFFSQLLLHCKLETPRYARFIDWCNLGLSWRQGQIQLAAKAKLDNPEEVTHNPSGVEAHPKNNALMVRHLGCFICHTDLPVVSYGLVPNSQKVANNIFGIQGYHGSQGGQDPINFNNVKLITCPLCFFTSASKDYFKKFEDDVPPKELTENFRMQWIKAIPTWKEALGPKFNPVNLDRDRAQVLRHYKMAIKSVESLSKKIPSSPLTDEALTHRLTIAQIQLAEGFVEEAEKLLNLVAELIKVKVIEVEAPKQLFRWHRLGIMISLYFGKVDEAKLKYKTFGNVAKSQNWEAEVRREQDAQLIYCQKAIRHAVRFEKSNLQGFYLKNLRKEE
ncbi:MAG: hypothetical protein QNL04_00220 [SAR324 cluster bacterium]|nr:hypothetical protein [SAR324 cluster bacterium]